MYYLFILLIYDFKLKNNNDRNNFILFKILNLNYIQIIFKLHLLFYFMFTLINEVDETFFFQIIALVLKMQNIQLISYLWIFNIDLIKCFLIIHLKLLKLILITHRNEIIKLIHYLVDKMNFDNKYQKIKVKFNN